VCAGCANLSPQAYGRIPHHPFWILEGHGTEADAGNA